MASSSCCAAHRWSENSRKILRPPAPGEHDSQFAAAGARSELVARELESAAPHHRQRSGLALPLPEPEAGPEAPKFLIAWPLQMPAPQRPIQIRSHTMPSKTFPWELSLRRWLTAILVPLQQVHKSCVLNVREVTLRV